MCMYVSDQHEDHPYCQISQAVVVARLEFCFVSPNREPNTHILHIFTENPVFILPTNSLGLKMLNSQFLRGKYMV